MHVGPTNSGKTHNALRALAAAERGLYAGPLRLLAHEIFERLNKGQIVPLGVDPDDGGEADENTNMDLLTTEGGKAVVRKEGNPKYARVCNLITGEEQKILDEYAGLFSCTVEMVGTSARRFDVAVVDEIQLISDPERGGSWTTAVLGICTKELHLCGEERAVPLIQALLKDTGDELIVNRYERLTPLEVAEKSMDGDFSKVEKGDCLVTFSRMNIFRLKARIEKHSGLKCAVAYGRLPPELRSEQAALFNKPGTGYDVMIGSDAIGMGLNLKIKRIIFEYVRKWDGTSEKLLSVSQFKQIAGRAGRYGMHSKNKPGIVVTMQEADMPILRKALELPVEPLRYARINAAADDFIAVMQALPLGTSLSTAMQVFKYVAKMHPRYEYMDISDGVSAFDYIDSVVGELTLSDRLLLQHAPILWRDPVAVRAVVQVMKMYKTDMFVDYRKLLKDTDMQASLDEALVMMETGETQGASEEMMSGLESLHKTLVLYIWMSFRSSVAFPEREAVEEVKNQTEKVMDWCLQCMSTVKRRVPVWRDQWQTQVDKGNYSETAGGSYVSGSQRDTWKAQDEGPRISIPRNKLASQPQQRRSESWP
ncbi:hypothetical protein EW026_g5938 [Hermanssonia centrifuga]|uniref:Helicase C-terminal domain-containing protein n=1 Tax=Hermanssonia centrifuga TaxID=98765 RepID=A0A4V3X9W7_9APHY|nr:hypothetical protein EW026_g5938 [Hermanssonia centrifuga]